MSNLYKTDFYQWTRQQIDLLKKNKFRALDLENLIEEVDDLGQEKVNTLENHLTRILVLLLKWHIRTFKEDLHALNRWYRSWFMVIDYSLAKERAIVKRLLMKNPSLYGLFDESLLECYPIACRDASRELEIPEDEFPDTNPWTMEQIMTNGFPPGPE
ncbi:DUF29 domain-containing protein [Endozoicomonas sp. ALB091]|uniref:DUF29 domain-containing protein n=1 Tax=Endozoicomonas sp. ALB091 TaxID=3403073 RepID=UPI003BB62BFB